jgi:hypothetical protein
MAYKYINRRKRDTVRDRSRWKENKRKRESYAKVLRKRIGTIINGNIKSLINKV